MTDVVRTWRAVAQTSSRREKISRIADALAHSDPDQSTIAVVFLSGELPQRQIGVGYRSLRESPPASAHARLTLSDVSRAFDAIKETTGPGSQAERRRLLTELFASATQEEQLFLRRLLTDELRQGALNGVMVEAIAAAAEVPSALVRRAHMLTGSLPEVARTAFVRGEAGLRAVGLVVGAPVFPMLAASAPDIGAAMSRVGTGAVEWKLDGIRVQVHRQGDQVTVFSRTLDDITARVPELVAAARGISARTFVLDGEAIALRRDGRPEPFQVTSARLASKSDAAALSETTPVTTFFFDALHLDDADLLDLPTRDRYAVFDEAVPERLRVPRLITDDESEASAFLDDAVSRGHEGVVVKTLDAPYAAGRRGSGWIKVKPRHTLDLVVLAAEWGHGRRRGWLSNLHLGARDPGSDSFVMLGKTFKGLTDELLDWQTARLLELADSPTDRWVVRVRPVLVVEIAFDGVQSSQRYPGGLALRFARVLRYRPDKRPEQADTFAAVRAIARQYDS